MSGAAKLTVWSIPLEREFPSFPTFQVLSASERKRALRFRFERDRRQFILSRAALRHILGAATEIEPSALQFRIGPRGKPEIANGVGHDISFNLSHCDGLALVVLAGGCDVGVDVEKVRPLADALQVARLVFSPAEIDAVLQSRGPHRDRTFLQYWTRKEALVKAAGVGITNKLTDICTFAPPRRQTSTIRFDEVGDPYLWTVRTLAFCGPYLAAVAARTERLIVHRRCWPADSTRF